jgi:hypothetical protein
MRSSSDPALRNKFPDPVFTVQVRCCVCVCVCVFVMLCWQTCAKKEHTKRKKKCQVMFAFLPCYYDVSLFLRAKFIFFPGSSGA